MPEVPKEFFTLQSMLTLTGASAVTLMVANGVQRAFNRNPQWLALLVAEVISIGTVLFTKYVASDIFVAFFNGFLIYCTAHGAADMVGRPPPGPVPRGAEDAAVPQSSKRSFFTRWN